MARITLRQGLFHVVDVESRHAIIILSGVIEQLAKGDTGHYCLLMLGIALAARLKEIRGTHKHNEERTSEHQQLAEHAVYC